MSLKGRDLRYADFYKSNLKYADLREAKLQGAVLYKAQLQGTVLDRAQLQRVTLYEAQLQGATLEYAQLQGAILNKASFKGTDFNRTTIGGNYFAAVDLNKDAPWDALLKEIAPNSNYINPSILHQFCTFRRTLYVNTIMRLLIRKELACTDSFAAEGMLRQDTWSMEEPYNSEFKKSQKELRLHIKTACPKIAYAIKERGSQLFND
ncbi:MAG: pentapeptide repeat-containing protein [Nitrospinae bacterium]|nr:pentapeptide repeat-containing protein [Nitrospinota bacterium]